MAHSAAGIGCVANQLGNDLLFELLDTRSTARVCLDRGTQALKVGSHVGDVPFVSSGVWHTPGAHRRMVADRRGPIRRTMFPHRAPAGADV
jgi:hypothetical protein